MSLTDGIHYMGKGATAAHAFAVSNGGLPAMHPYPDAPTDYAQVHSRNWFASATQWHDQVEGWLADPNRGEILVIDELNTSSLAKIGEWLRTAPACDLPWELGLFLSPGLAVNYHNLFVDVHKFETAGLWLFPEFYLRDDHSWARKKNIVGIDNYLDRQYVALSAIAPFAKVSPVVAVANEYRNAANLVLDRMLQHEGICRDWILPHGISSWKTGDNTVDIALPKVFAATSTARGWYL